MNRLDQIAELQSLDIRIEENARSRREAEKRIDDQSSVLDSREAVDQTERKLREIRTRVKSFELEASGIGEKLRGVEKRLYDGRTSNPKELEGLEADSQMLKRNKSDVEDRLLDTMAEQEEAEAILASEQSLLEKATTEASASTARARRDLEEIENRETKLKSDRERLRAQITPEDLSLYEGLRREKKGHAVARLKGSACDGCGCSLPSGLLSRVRVGRDIEFCNNCGRILVP